LSEVWLLNFLRLCNFAGEPRQTPKPLQLLPSAKGWKSQRYTESLSELVTQTKHSVVSQETLLSVSPKPSLSK
jgi:hypothetical protein